MSTVYFNEIDRYPAAWLRNLYPSATVDERSIADVGADDVTGYTRCHWFAGIAGWEYALDLAGWPADREVWTGSCPCQPFSAAGRGLGADDPRHLWPAFYRLIAERRPSVVFGEQVSGAAGRAWLSAVRADLEAIGYAVGAADLCAASVGAPHIRQRLYWVANRTGAGLEGAARAELQGRGDRPTVSGADGRLVDAQGARLPTRVGGGEARFSRPERASQMGGLADTGSVGLDGRTGIVRDRGEAAERIEARRDAWHDSVFLPSSDGRARPTGKRFRLLADGLSATMGGESTTENQEINDGSPPPQRSGKDVRSLRDAACSEDVQRPSGGSGRVRPSSVLQSGMHGRGDDGDDQGSERKERATAGAEDGEGRVRVLRAGGQSSVRSPHRRESDEQYPGELADFVRLLPSSIALAQWGHDNRTADTLLALLQSSAPAGAVLDSLDAIEAVWRSLAYEDQTRVYLGARARGVVAAPISPLAHGVPARASKLRAYGNAIVPQLAAVFVRAFMDAEADV